MASTNIYIRPVTPADRVWVRALMGEQWGPKLWWLTMPFTTGIFLKIYLI